MRSCVRLARERASRHIPWVPPQIISASRRTDLPAFFSTWWMNRVREERVLVRNPRNASQVMDVSLAPEDVVAVVYWSRDYGHLIPHLPELDDRGLRSCFHLTLTGYGRDLELRGPPVRKVVEQAETLAARYGPKRTTWRYDPIVIGSAHTPSYHEDRFGRLAEALAPLVERCVISFLDPYPSARRELAALEARGVERFAPPPHEVRRGLARRLVELGRALDLPVRACCEPDVADVVSPARCIDPDWIRSFAPAPEGSFRFMATRKGCGCVFARDVGAYHTCAHGCVYCYANESPEAGLRNAREVEPLANHLGKGMLEPRAPEKKRSFESGQLCLGNVLASRTYDEPKPDR